MNNKIACLFLSMSIFCHADIDFEEIHESEEHLILPQEYGQPRGLALVPKIKARTDTLRIPIRQSDAVDGVITIHQMGSYLVANNLLADVVITGTNVLVDLEGRSIFGSVSVHGAAVIVKNGAIVPLPPQSIADGLKAALTVYPYARGIKIQRCHFDCWDSMLTASTVDPYLPGRSGIEVQGSVVNIVDCSIIAGSAAATTGTHAGEGGHAIILSNIANRVRIFECIMLSGAGGDADTGNGGNGGHGIYIKDTVSHIEIRECTMFGTGNGGNSGSEHGGNGGHGICIESSASDIDVHDCRIRNTGVGGEPDGMGGKAIMDSVITPGAVSIICSNFAHNISNDIKFDLRGTQTEKGIEITNPPDGSVCSPYANIYVA